MALIKHGNNALSSVTAFPTAIATGKPVLLSTVTASSSSSIEFTSGIDSTYDIYKFELINIHPSADGMKLQFNLSTDGGSTYAVTKTTTFFIALHYEADTSASLNYNTGNDLAQSTADQTIINGIGSDNDASGNAVLYLFSPSSTTYVKHFIANCNRYGNGNTYSGNDYMAGYGNTTSAINAIKFVPNTGTIDTGSIKMYGISA